MTTSNKYTSLYNKFLYSEVPYNILTELSTKKEFYEHINYWYNCNCCQKHQKNKPKFDILNNIISVKNRKSKKHICVIYSCNCVCRHWSRMLIRKCLIKDLEFNNNYKIDLNKKVVINI